MIPGQRKLVNISAKCKVSNEISNINSSLLAVWGLFNPQENFMKVHSLQIKEVVCIELQIVLVAGNLRIKVKNCDWNWN